MAGHQVALVVFPDFQLLDATGPAEVFAAASEALPKGEGYALRLLSPEGGLVRSSTGLALMTEALPAADELAGATLLVAGGHGVQRAMGGGALARWLAAVAPAAERCGSVCTGAFLLAQAGLLDGRPVVTHWRYAELLQRLFPRLQVLQGPSSWRRAVSTARPASRRAWTCAWPWWRRITAVSCHCRWPRGW